MNNDQLEKIASAFRATGIYKDISQTNAGEDIYLVYAGQTLVQSGTVSDLLERAQEVSE